LLIGVPLYLAIHFGLVRRRKVTPAPSQPQIAS
jgi:hypothetical protein